MRGRLEGAEARDGGSVLAASEYSESHCFAHCFAHFHSDNHFQQIPIQCTRTVRLFTLDNVHTDQLATPVPPSPHIAAAFSLPPTLPPIRHGDGYQRPRC